APVLGPETLVFVDGHVHIYSCYDPAQVLDGAWRHISAAATKQNAAGNFQGVLIFTESAGDTVFESMSEASRVGRWRISHTTEPKSLSLRRDDEAHLLLLAGRQLISAERLELSAYFVTETLADGAPLDNLMEQVLRKGGVAVLPWGVGKWLGKRGPIVEEALMQRQLPLMVSDNGGRPWFWPTPRLFRTAMRLRVPILAGSDSLPMASEEQKAGGFGFILSGALSKEAPCQDIKTRLSTMERSPSHFGHRAGGWSFSRNQIIMQVRRSR